jgi:hypothetical protein
MWITFFLSIMNKLSEASPYFIERHDTTGHSDLTPLQKGTTTLHLLAYVMTADTIDEYMKLDKTIVLECLKYYYAGTVDCYGVEFLRCPTVINIQRLLAKVEER